LERPAYQGDFLDGIVSSVRNKYVSCGVDRNA
jgi:hypothetical protein